MHPLRLAPIAIALAAFVPPPAAAAPETYVVDPAHTFPQFELDHLGFSRHRGRFNRSAGRIELDRAAGRGALEIRIDAASVDTGDEKLESVLRSDAFFDVARHPEIVYRSTALRFEGERPVAVDGELTMLGVTRPLRLQVDHFRCGPVPILRHWVCGANATASLRRSDFGIDRFLSLGLGDEVRLTLQIEARRETPPAPTIDP